MKLVKILVIALLLYVGIVAAFESAIGYLQPAGDSTLVITTFDGEGTAHDRVVSRLESQGKLYVAANHWPRAWYGRALDNPSVRVTHGGEQREYRAVRVDGAEHEQVDEAHALPVFFRFLTGFPPRRFLRLDPA